MIHDNGKSYRVLAVIPARGGSRGIHKKNIAPLDGKPMMQYTIEYVECFQILLFVHVTFTLFLVEV